LFFGLIIRYFIPNAERQEEGKEMDVKGLPQAEPEVKLSEFENFKGFYEKARSNKLASLWKGERLTRFQKYSNERDNAFIDWCDYMLEELAKTDPKTFTAIEWRKEYGMFEYPEYVE